MKAYDINIAIVHEDEKTENIFYQRFTDEPYRGKAREIVRVVNDFDEPKRFPYRPTLTIDYLNGMTTEAKAMADQTGASLNWELLKILNKWIDENL